MATAAARFGVKTSIVKKYHSYQKRGLPIPGYASKGPRPALSDAEDAALNRFVQICDRGAFPLTTAMLITYANYLRTQRTVPAGPVPVN